MHAIVTGASGFVGKYLRAHLLEQGDSVVGLDAIGSDEVLAVDITDPVATRTAFLESRSETEENVIFHLAAISHVGESWDAPLRTWNVNLLGTLHVLAAATEIGAHRVIVIASSEVYGTVAASDCPLVETQAIRPTSPYGASKAAADIAALQAFLSGALPTIRVRSFNHTGPGQSPAFLLPALAQRIADAERIGDSSIPVGNLDAIRDVSDVRDVVRAYRLLATSGVPGEAYHVCSGVGHSVRELAEMMLDSSSTVRSLEVDPALVRAVDIPVLIGSNAKLRNDTGWEPTISLSETFGNLLAAAREKVS